MAIRLLAIITWTVIFFFGSAMLLGFASGLYIFATLLIGGEIGDQTTEFIGRLWAVAPMIMGPIGLALGIAGKLPFTRHRTPTS